MTASHGNAYQGYGGCAACLRQAFWRLRTDHVGAILFICAVALSIPLLAAMMGIDGREGSAAYGVATPESPDQARGRDDPPAPVPLEFLPIPVNQAVRVNAAVPFVPTGVAAPRFLLSGSALDHEAAMRCLAAAVLYEAGDDRTGQQAVAQVVLNRLRHPAFPKTVCGVVFQGSQRATGCQFTFTCDGALNRKMPAGAWARAEMVAEAALNGAVDRSVGLATHYHTNWVVPRWSASLDKIAQVGTHLFFRMKGSASALRAYSGLYAGNEVLDARLRPGGGEAALAAGPASPSLPASGLASVTQAKLPAQNAPGTSPAAVTNLRGATMRAADAATGMFILLLPANGFSGSPALTAHELCRGRTRCTVVGYTDPRAAANLPLRSAELARAAFYYDGGADRAYWNCAKISRPSTAECIPGTAPSALAEAAMGVHAAAR